MCRLTCRNKLSEEIPTDLRSSESKIELGWLVQHSASHAPRIHVFCAFPPRLETRVERIAYWAAVTVLPEEQSVYQKNCSKSIAICQTFHPLATQSAGVLIAAKNNGQSKHTVHPPSMLLQIPNLAT